jgi:hypothetical protein
MSQRARQTDPEERILNNTASGQCLTFVGHEAAVFVDLVLSSSYWAEPCLFPFFSTAAVEGTQWKETLAVVGPFSAVEGPHAVVLPRWLVPAALGGIFRRASRIVSSCLNFRPILLEQDIFLFSISSYSLPAVRLISFFSSQAVSSSSRFVCICSSTCISFREIPQKYFIISN